MKEAIMTGDEKEKEVVIEALSLLIIEIEDTTKVISFTIDQPIYYTEIDTNNYPQFIQGTDMYIHIRVLPKEENDK